MFLPTLFLSFLTRRNSWNSRGYCNISASFAQNPASYLRVMPREFYLIEWSWRRQTIGGEMPLIIKKYINMHNLFPIQLHSVSQETQHVKFRLFLGRVQIDELCSAFHFANALGNNVQKNCCKLLSESFDKMYITRGQGQ